MTAVREIDHDGELKAIGQVPTSRGPRTQPLDRVAANANATQSAHKLPHLSYPANILMKCLLAAGLGLAVSTFASAQQGVSLAANLTPEQYHQMAVSMCHQSVAMPSPYGEVDIKDSPKFDAYCGCFADRFSDRRTKIMNGGGTQPTLKENVAAERALRNACRAQMGLPELVFRK